MRTRTQTLTLTQPEPQHSPHLKQASLETGLEVLGEPTKLVKPDSMPETLTCGFLGASAPPNARARVPRLPLTARHVAGEPDAGGFYARGSRNIRDMAAKGAAPSADSKGRIGGTGGS